jgi:hypothetical protein
MIPQTLKIEDAPNSLCRQADYLIPSQLLAVDFSLVQDRVQKPAKLRHSCE